MPLVNDRGPLKTVKLNDHEGLRDQKKILVSWK